MSKLKIAFYFSCLVFSGIALDETNTAAQTIAYRGADNRSVTRMVANHRLLDGLKRGDIVEITYSRERTIELTRTP